MSGYALFSDVSLNTKSKTGIGAFLIQKQDELMILPEEIKKEYLQELIKQKVFYDTSSTKLEVQTLLHALDYLNNNYPEAHGQSMIIYTDSQCIAGLPERRKKLENNNFCKRGTEQLIRNAELYREFYRLQDEMKFEVIKVKGHSKSKLRDTIHRIFSIVDRKARAELRKLEI